MPKVSADSQYYNRAQINESHLSSGDGVYRNYAPSNLQNAKRNDGTVISDSVDGDNRWNVVPYAREYPVSYTHLVSRARIVSGVPTLFMPSS